MRTLGVCLCVNTSRLVQSNPGLEFKSTTKGGFPRASQSSCLEHKIVRHRMAASASAPHFLGATGQKTLDSSTGSEVMADSHFR